MIVFFDANVILDWILKREPTFSSSSTALRETIRLGYTGVISCSSINDIHYVIRKELKNESLARTKTEQLLTLFRLAKVDESILGEAMKLKGRDFEDDIVVAAAMKFGADCIVTNNTKDFEIYSKQIPVFSPEGYLEYLRNL